VSQLPDPQSLAELADTFEAQQPVAGGKGLGSRIHKHFAQLGGVELELPERSSLPTSVWS
jgi:hypothetical protein